MESSKLGTDAGECGVGSIVWVRRRNGSWWPGKILEPEELTTSHLTSPRSGAPVKLLGRDDASVDWYNLEKSKRVKAFRCGEFDDCIERAEASLGMPTRKREKYARREDAILHALELEKELLTKQGQLGVFTENQSDSSGLTPNNLLERSGTFFKDNSVRSHLNLQITNDQDQSSFENEDSEVIPRLRGSMDLAVRTAPPKQKHSPPSLSDGFEKPTLDNNHQTPTSNAAGIGSTSPVNGEQTGVFKTKRTAYIYSPAESSEGLDHKEAPPYQTGLSHLQFEDGDCCLRTELSIEESSSGFIEDDETDSSESESESEDHLSETEPDMDEKMTVSGASIHREANYRSRTLVEQATMSSKEYDQSVLSSDISHPHPHDPISPYEAVSKWQLKGKRNIRHLTKDFVDGPDKKGFGGSNHGTYHESGVAAVKQSKLTQKFSFWRKEDFSDAVDVADFGDKDFCTQMIGLDGGYGFRLRAAPVGQNSFSHKIIDWDNMPWEDQPAPRGHWLNNEIHPRGSGRYSTGGRARSVLVDVDLKVQASYKKGLVPIISLLSKVDGKAIIGHPIQIDTLEDGSSENLIPANNYFDNILVNHDRTLPLAWRTVRRSNFCVPRSVLSSFPNGDVAAGSRSVLVQDRRDSKKSRAVGFCYKESKIRKSQSNTMGRRSLKKQQKKVGLSSVQKTRTLSSIAIDHGLRSRALYDTSNGQLIKPVSSGPTTVACIPVKLAFSRLLEKINRPPSKICSNLFISRSDAERNLS